MVLEEDFENQSENLSEVSFLISPIGIN